VASLIEELQRDALNSSVQVTGLLQKCLVVGSKLKIPELTTWARKELDGYPQEPVPKYREVYGFPQVLNPLRGYQPLQCQRAEHLRLFSSVPFNQPIGELEHSLKRAEASGSDGFHVSYSAEMEIALRKAIRPSLGLTPSLLVNASQFQKILDAVRKSVLEWALELEAAGVKGDGMSFSAEEKKRAHSVTYNIATNIYGNVERSQVGVTGNGNVQHDAGPHPDMDDLRKIVADLRDNLEEFKLQRAERSELEADIQTLSAQAASPRPKISIIKESLASVRNILEGIVGNLAAAAILRQIGR